MKDSRMYRAQLLLLPMMVSSAMIEPHSKNYFAFSTTDVYKRKKRYSNAPHSNKFIKAYASIYNTWGYSLSLIHIL